MPTFGDFLYAGIYQHACRFANVERFVDIVSADTDLTTTTDAESAWQTMRDITTKLELPDTVRTDEEAARSLAARDLALVSRSDLVDVEVKGSVGDRLDRHGPLIQERLTSIGLPVGEAPLRVVDEFPAPFNQFDWSAFAPDREDEENFHIEPGVYFRRDRLRPMYSEALFAHEVVHTVTGRTDPEVYAMGLEEGVAEVLGTCFGTLAVLPAEVIKNIVVYGRHGAERAKLWSVYLDHTRQAYLLYREFGLDGLVELARQGRAAIHGAEEKIAAGRLTELSLPRGRWDDGTSQLLDFLCCGYLPSHVFSPLECLLAVHATAGRSFDEICARAGVAPEVGGPALKRLGAESALFICDGERIGYSNVARYLSMETTAGIAVIRYLPS